MVLSVNFVSTTLIRAPTEETGTNGTTAKKR